MILDAKDIQSDVFDRLESHFQGQNIGYVSDESGAVGWIVEVVVRTMRVALKIMPIAFVENNDIGISKLTSPAG